LVELDGQRGVDSQSFQENTMNKDLNAPNPKSSKPTQRSGQNDPQVDFGKPQGSSRHDEADLRDVARKAAKKSQQLNEPREE
jgi:hypothetical protein